MKNGIVLVKSIVLFLLIVLVLTNSTIIIAQDLLNGDDTKKDIQAIIETNVSKYVNYSVNENEKGVIIQFNVKSGLNCDENLYSPIKELIVAMQMPKINNKYPRSCRNYN